MNLHRVILYLPVVVLINLSFISGRYHYRIKFKVTTSTSSNGILKVANLLHF